MEAVGTGRCWWAVEHRTEMQGLRSTARAFRSLQWKMRHSIRHKKEDDMLAPGNECREVELQQTDPSRLPSGSAASVFRTRGYPFKDHGRQETAPTLRGAATSCSPLEDSDTHKTFQVEVPRGPADVGGTPADTMEARPLFFQDMFPPLRIGMATASCLVT